MKENLRKLNFIYMKICVLIGLCEMTMYIIQNGYDKETLIEFILFEGRYKFSFFVVDKDKQWKLFSVFLYKKKKRLEVTDVVLRYIFILNLFFCVCVWCFLSLKQMKKVNEKENVRNLNLLSNAYRNGLT